ISLTTTALVVNYTVNYTKKYGNENYQELVSKINQTNLEVNKLKSNQLNGIPVKTEPKVDYRATGFLIDGKGYLVTNAHVLSKMKNIYVENNKGEYYNAVSVYTDNIADLAILKINDTS